MVNSAGRLSDFWTDLKSSWYFRVWLLLWLVCAIISFASLIIFAENVGLANKQKFQRVYFDNEKIIHYPQFHFRVEGGSEVLLDNVTCNYNGATTVHTMKCETSCCGDYNTSTCQAVDASHLVSKAIDSNVHQAINCVIYGHVPYQVTNNALLAWELDDENSEGIVGDNAYASIWIEPYTWGWVMITKINEDGKIDWERDLLYHAYYDIPEGETIMWQVSTMINTHKVLYIENHDIVQADWSVPALAGGFGFFTYALHAIAMFLVGFLLENNSKFLLGPAAAQSYQAV